MLSTVFPGMFGNMKELFGRRYVREEDLQEYRVTAGGTACCGCWTRRRDIDAGQVYPLTLESEAFAGLKRDFDVLLERTLSAMRQKDGSDWVVPSLSFWDAEAGTWAIRPVDDRQLSLFDNSHGDA